jgi:hypothetical protein
MLRNLALAHGGTAMAMVGVTLVAAAGYARRGALLSALVAACAISGAWIGGKIAPSADASLGASIALGLLVGLLTGATIVALAVRSSFGVFVRATTAAKVAVALAAAILAGAYVPTPGSRILCAFPPIVPLAIYVAIVAALGEPVKALVMGKRAQPH